MTENHKVKPRRPIVVGASLGALLLLAVVGSGLWNLTRNGEPHPPMLPRESSAPVPPLPPASDYAGSASCRECHQDVWDRYRTHPMARSMSPVSEPVAFEDDAVPTQFFRGKREYAVERIGDRVFHHERQSNEAGEPVYDQAVEVHYRMGSGTRGRSYLIDRDGLLFLSPIAWYAQGAKWDLSPGYPEDDHQRFERRVIGLCIACHAGRAAPDPEWINRFQQPAIIEFGIG